MIKKTFFTAVLCLFYFSVFSQQNTQLKLNTKNEGISMYGNREPFFQAKPFNFNDFLKDSIYSKGIFIPKIPPVQLFLGQNRVETPMPFYKFKNMDNMPVMIPDEIKIPDSRNNYILLLKD